jgi:hypothetical protein
VLTIGSAVGRSYDRASFLPLEFPLPIPQKREGPNKSVLGVTIQMNQAMTTMLILLWVSAIYLHVFLARWDGLSDKP